MSGSEPGTLAASPPGLADGGWHRLHPLSPAIKSWQIVVVVLLFAGQNLGVNAAEDGLPDLSRPHLAGRWLAGGGALLIVVILLIAALATLSWRMTRFRVTAETLELHSGVLFRQQRQARLDRVQAIDVVQPLLARVFGLARLSVEVAGGSGSGVNLQYLTEAQAQSLRGHLLARAAGVQYDTDEAPEAPEHLTLEVPVQRLLGSLVLSGTAVWLLVGAVALVVSAALTGRVAVGVGIFPMLLGVVSLLWARFNGGFGFRLATSPDGLRLRHGLLEHRAQTVPPGRIQAVRISQTLLWRSPDWWKVDVNVAGYGGTDDDGRANDSVLLPVGTRDEAIEVLALALPDLGVDADEDPREVIAAALTGSGPQPGWLVAPARSRWVDLISWRRTGVRVTREALVIRGGRLFRRAELVPHARSQSWGLAQGPLQRRLGLATFTLHSTPGPVSPSVRLDALDALRLLGEEADRARLARATAGPERWMERPPAPVSESPAVPSSPASPDPSPGPASPGTADSSPA